MAKESERLVMFGFCKGNEIEIEGKKYKIEGNTPEKRGESIKKIKLSLPGRETDIEKALEKIATHEWAELSKNQMVITGYPQSLNRYAVVLESWHQSVESTYYWCLNFLNDIGFVAIDKLNDVFSAAEHSSFYGAAGQRLGMAQDKVAQYLATIGKMTKDLFQIVRELRWIDERLEIYRDAFGHDKTATHSGAPKTKEPAKGAEVTLKGLWADLVDGVVGGQRTGSNIFLMQQQLNFTTLPDLFFAVQVPAQAKDEADVDKAIEEQAGFANEPLKNVLRRKLVQYSAWKKATYDEMINRRKFTIDYLQQHWYVIKLYISWVKPYLRHIKRLTSEQDFLANPRLISAFESSMIEIEILARLKPEGEDDYSCILMTFEYHTKPAMQYPGDAGYHRGPIHVGTLAITWRSYGWSEEQVKNYQKMKEIEDLELMSSLDKSLASAMEQLGTDIGTYLEEARKAGQKEQPKEELPKGIDIFEPFVAVGKGVKDMVKSLIPELPKFASKKEGSKEVSDTVTNRAKRMCFTHYNVFKKSQGLLSW